MDITVLIVLIIGLIGAGLGVFFLFQFSGSGGAGELQSQMRNMSTKAGSGGGLRGSQARGGDPLQAMPKRRKTSAALTLEKKLKYSQWKMPPMVFRILEVVFSLIAFGIANRYFNVGIQVFSLGTGPLIMRWALGSAMARRFRAFDSDYPQMLLSLVGLLKTGMNPMQALEMAARGLDEGALVREEIEMMIMRLRYGVPEDKSIGAFGEDIYHPEIELFVQALLLSRRVGGTLSDTLDRLAKQVRKRQYFRMSARAAVGMQRGSIWFIMGILAFLEVYLYFVYPQAVVGAIMDEDGWQVWQFGMMVVGLGIFWITQVTRIRV
ncbi:MAG: type II secretion system F family protein [Bdellovibrionales bacterium]|nr:type II secretion system F family protein [Bdellovibrionales bacterium]